MKRLIIIALILVNAVIVHAQGANIGNNASTVVNNVGRPLAGVSVAICQPMATTAASVVSNVAVLTMASNPITAGYAQGMTIQVLGFTGGDTYFNGGVIVSNQITSGFTILSVTSTTITYTLVHANAAAGTNGTVLQEGNLITPCGGIVTVYTDPGEGTTAINPFVTDGYGNWQVFGPPSVYYAQFYGAGVTTNIRTIDASCVPSGVNCGTTQINVPNTWSALQTFSAGITSTFLRFGETAAPSASLTNDICYGDSVAHALECSYNNGAFGIVPLINATQSWTATQIFLNITTNNILSNGAGMYTVGSAPLPYFNMFFGSAANQSTALASNATANRTATFPDFSGMEELVIGSGTTALGTGALGAAGCEATVTVVSAAVTTATRIVWNYATDPSAVAGYGGVPIDAVHILAWPTAGNVNFKQCSAVAVTPGAMSILWNAVN